MGVTFDQMYESMLAQREQLKKAVRDYFERHRIVAIVSPPILVPPPKIGEEVEVEIRGQKILLYVAMSRNLSLGSCASMTSLVLPAGTTSSGLALEPTRQPDDAALAPPGSRTGPTNQLKLHSKHKKSNPDAAARDVQNSSGPFWHQLLSVSGSDSINDWYELVVAGHRVRRGNPIGQRIESFLGDVLALAGEEPDAV
jgi:hypothetical protein